MDVNTKPKTEEMKKYSLNLYKFIKKFPYRNQIFVTDIDYGNGSIVKDVMLIGYMDKKGWFDGNEIMRVCCGMINTRAYAPLPWETHRWKNITERFWKDYEHSGVCAINNYPNSHVWDYKGKTKRICKNCGRIEHRKTIRISKKIWQ